MGDENMNFINGDAFKGAGGSKMDVVKVFTGPYVIMFNGSPLESWSTQKKADHFAEAVVDHEKRCGRECTVSVEYDEDYDRLNRKG